MSITRTVKLAEYHSFVLFLDMRKCYLVVLYCLKHCIPHMKTPPIIGEALHSWGLCSALMYGLWAGRDVYRATTDAIRDLGFFVSSMTSKGYGGLLKCHRDLMGPIVKHKVCNSTYIKRITSHSHPIFSLQISLFYFLNCHFLPSYNTDGMFYWFYFCYLSLYGWNIADMT